MDIPRKIAAAKTGRDGEDAACALLLSQGFEILDRNYRTRFGEIDIVARKKDLLVFAEVKARTSFAFGGPLAAVTPAKQKKITVAALYYLKEKNLRPDSIRFDVIALLAGKPPEHIPDAFRPQSWA